MKYLITYIVAFLIIAKAGTIQGKIVGSENENLIGASVLIIGTTKGATTDINGHFILTEISLGQIILYSSYSGYISRTDTINVTNPNEVDSLIIQLKIDAGTIEELEKKLLGSHELSEITSYRKSISGLIRFTKPLALTIDSVYCNSDKEYNGEMLANLKFSNNSSDSIYLLRNYPCLQTLSVIIVNESKDTIQRRERFIDFVGEKCQYDSSDLIVVPPHSTINYPRVTIWLRSCKSLDNGLYVIRVVYSYKLPNKIYWIQHFKREQLLVYLKAIEINIESDNVWTLENRMSNNERNH